MHNYNKPDEIKFYQTLGRKIKLMRISKGMTQSDLAEHIGKTFQQVQKYEKGVNRIPVIDLVTIAEVFKTTILFFITETELLGYVKLPGDNLAKPSNPSGIKTDVQDSKNV